jgi:hypothetical protein
VQKNMFTIFLDGKDWIELDSVHKIDPLIVEEGVDWLARFVSPSAWASAGRSSKQIAREKKVLSVDSTICADARQNPGIHRESIETARKKILSAHSKRPVVHALMIPVLAVT